jgi:hypothetical protein
LATLPALVVLAACSATDTPGPTAIAVSTGTAMPPESAAASAPGGTALGACDLAEPAQVGDIFGGTVTTEEPGVARNCHYPIEGGVSRSVEVYYYGTESEWPAIRATYEQTRGPLSDVTGIGDEAFHPADAGPYEVVVRAGGQVFAVGVVEGTGGPAVESAIAELATAIADSL